MNSIICLFAQRLQHLFVSSASGHESWVNSNQGRAAAGEARLPGRAAQAKFRMKGQGKGSWSR